jgi:hypothetical protein
MAVKGTNEVGMRSSFVREELLFLLPGSFLPCFGSSFDKYGTRFVMRVANAGGER